MAWLKTLAETYDLFDDLAGVDKDEQILLPLAHSTFNAQIEVIIDEEGIFIDSKKVEKADAVTIIPVTEDSAARANGNCPHPLCDKLCYIAGDYTVYTGDNKDEYFRAYIEQLQEWVESEDTHFMVNAIYNYLKKKTLIGDLSKNMTLELNEEGFLTDQIKLQGLGQTGANVRFIVYCKDKSVEDRVWKNQGLYKKYINFYRKKAGDLGICYVLGEQVPCSDKHPYKIRNSGDKAKLISGNDESGFTYRGRFVNKNQAVSVGYEVSQKAHNALRWLLQRQGYVRDESAIVCWMVNRDMQLPDIMKDSINAYSEIDYFDIDNLLTYDFSNKMERDTGVYFGTQFRNAIKGYAGKIKEDDRVAIISLDAATTGRLSIVYYDEMGGKQYISAILDWQEHCKWRRTVTVGKSETIRKKITLECTPAPRDMALAAFGTQRSEWLDADSKLIKATIKRLLPCITNENMKIPSDIIKAAARRASMPEAMSDFVWRNDVLSVVCAMIRLNYERKEENERSGKTMNTFLEDNKNDRNVLWGRLLAICDYMEMRALYERDENGKLVEIRTTNAKRYWNAFSSRPFKTYKTISENLRSYERKLNGIENKLFADWTSELMEYLAQINGFDSNALSEMYLPGYYLQMSFMKSEINKMYEKNKESKGE